MSRWRAKAFLPSTVYSQELWSNSPNAWTFINAIIKFYKFQITIIWLGKNKKSALEIKS